jgi:DNA-directed RNA polymerase specialized sigma24 family protein
MQPHTEPIDEAPRRDRRGDEADLFRRHHRDLVRAVSHAVNASVELVEDACQTAWTILLRRQPDRASLFGWLYVVAVHEAYRLSSIERRDARLEDLAADATWDRWIADRLTLDDRVEAREALRALAGLPDSQRRDLALLVGGFGYHEIAEMTGGRTYTNANKHLVKARARIRAARSRDAGATPKWRASYE